ncbi:hypothetical protein GLOIN_2v1546875, partial [Rhizophagus irregularis DAOM 181602=DAOM 197198]
PDFFFKVIEIFISLKDSKTIVVSKEVYARKIMVRHYCIVLFDVESRSLKFWSKNGIPLYNQCSFL